MLNCFSSLTVPTLGEMEQIICMLERGTIVTKLYNKQRRPEQRRLILVRETRQLLWSPVTANTRIEHEGSLELREIREIRVGKNSKEFRNCPDEAKRFEFGKCFVVLHGNSFKLKTFSVVALSEQEAENWVKGLRYMMQDTINAPYPLQVERWLRREYYAIENSGTQSSKDGGQVTIKDFKAFLASISCKMTTSKLMDCFSEEDVRRKNDLRFDDFARLYRKLIQPTSFIEDIFHCLPGKEFAYSKENGVVTLREFEMFLLQEQRESIARDNKSVSNFMREFLQDVEREVQEPYFTVSEFLDYLFSKHNDLWDKQCDRLYMDMKQPMSNYWIASSHNTYLTGDQFSSESSCEAYVRALRMGCRCIELDCWNGPDNQPHIFHGHTMTSKIKFKDVIKTIKEHAFVTSEYPVILSIEQNCSLEQQRNMAQALLEVFGDMLLTQRCDRSETQLPSPYQLRRKIILKHKKLPEYEDNSNMISSGSNSSTLLSSSSSRGSISGPGGDDNDGIRNVLKEGLLYFKDPVDKTWSLYNFVLTQQELIYTSETEDTNSTAGDDEDIPASLSSTNTLMPKVKDSMINDELHFGENWFHGKLEGGRHEADQLLEAYKHLGDGTFLVRESATFVGDYSLSFWRRNKPNHCRIKLKHENGATKYYLVDNFVFDSLYSLIVYYRKNMLRSSEFSITLKEPVPQPKKHESQEWFHPHTTKEQAEQVLIKLDVGSFLVRPSVQNTNTFVISFTINRKIKHCRIMQEGRLFVVDTNQFESLVSLVKHYMRNPLYRTVKLMYPVSQELLKQKLLACQSSLDHGNAEFNDASSYMDPSLEDTVTCKALYSYKADKPDELSFPKHAIITNVQRNSTMWWKGDYGGLKQRHLPANYVKVFLQIFPNQVQVHSKHSENKQQPGWVLTRSVAPSKQLVVPQLKVIDSASDDNSSLCDETHNEQFSRTDSIEIHGAVAALLESNEPGILLKLQIQIPTMQNSFVVGFDNQEQACEWFSAIQEAALIANQLATERRKKERSARVAKEMSDLIIYFRSVPFREHSWVFYEMSSFPETKAEKQFLQQNTALFLAYHRYQISRVYPKGQRLDSSNFNPVPFWNVGSQMIALNYQTGDKAMQLNQAKFRDNAQCGYLLKPSFMLAESFDPNNPLTISRLEEKLIIIRIIAARHLFRAGKCSNPMVVVEVAGASFDSGVKHRTKFCENGFNPVWNETCEFSVRNPYFALLRFEIQDEDIFAETHFIAQASYQLNCIRTGYRSVILRNKFSEELELASLLIHVEVKQASETENHAVLGF